jgi:hypothetical protein
MARSPKSPSSKQKVTVDADHYRSLILGKLRADIDAKRAILEAAAVVDIGKLQGMGYYKMKYWRMKYYKMHGSQEFGEEVVNPVIGATGQIMPGQG